jgi:hypothetical protein
LGALWFEANLARECVALPSQSIAGCSDMHLSFQTVQEDEIGMTMSSGHPKQKKVFETSSQRKNLCVVSQ